MEECRMLIHIGIAMLCGASLGLERQIKRHPAGLRTLTLVCMGASLIASADSRIHVIFDTKDTFRLTAQIISGIGFLGAGTILHQRDTIKGLTTAACLWLTAAIGIVVGLGFYWVGIGVTLMALFVLVVLQWFEDRLPNQKRKNDIMD